MLLILARCRQIRIHPAPTDFLCKTSLGPHLLDDINKEIQFFQRWMAQKRYSPKYQKHLCKYATAFLSFYTSKAPGQKWTRTMYWPLIPIIFWPTVSHTLTKTKQSTP